MTTARRTLTRTPAAALSSRIGDALMRRRGERQAAKQATSTEHRKPSKNPQVVQIPKEEMPLTDILSKSKFTSRPPRQTEYIHVSDLLGAGKCIRKIALRERYDLPIPNQTLSLTDSLTYAQGDAIHDVLRARVARGGQRSIWGTWGCRCGTTKTLEPCTLSEVDQTQLCNACKTPRNVYHEVPMRDKELMIVGTPDLILYLHAHEAYYVSELKSIAHDKWKDLVRPDPEHTVQVLFYWFLMNRKGYRLSNRVSVLYATKGWMFSGNPFKEFTFDAHSMVQRLEPYLEDARALKACRLGSELPARICASESAPVARKCEACTVCFKGTDEAPTKVDIRHALRSKVNESVASHSGDRPVANQHRVRLLRRR